MDLFIILQQCHLFAWCEANRIELDDLLNNPYFLHALKKFGKWSTEFFWRDMPDIYHILHISDILEESEYRECCIDELVKMIELEYVYMTDSLETVREIIFSGTKSLSNNVSIYVRSKEEAESKFSQIDFTESAESDNEFMKLIQEKEVVKESEDSSDEDNDNRYSSDEDIGDRYSSDSSDSSDGSNSGNRYSSDGSDSYGVNGEIDEDERYLKDLYQALRAQFCY